MLREGVVRNVYPHCCGSYRAGPTCPVCGKTFRMSLVSRLIHHLSGKVAGCQIDYQGMKDLKEEDIDRTQKKFDRFRRLGLEVSKQKARHRLETYKALLDTVLYLVQEHQRATLKLRALKRLRGDPQVPGQDYRDVLERTLVQIPGRHGCPELAVHPY